MKRKMDVKNWIMLGLLAAIIVVLLTQPIIVTSVNTNAWTTSNGTWRISEVEIIDGEADSTENQYSPSVDSGIAVWSEGVVGSNRYLVKYRDLSGDDVYFVDNRSGASQLSCDIDNRRIVFTNDIDGSSNVYFNDIWMKNLRTGQLSKLTNVDTVDNELMYPKISGNYVAYIRNNDGGILYRDLNTNIEYELGVYSVSGLDISGRFIAFVDMLGEMYYYNIETGVTAYLGGTFGTRVSIHDGVIAYSKWDVNEGNWVSGMYDIETKDYTRVEDAAGNFYTDYVAIADGVIGILGQRLGGLEGDFFSQIYLVDRNVDEWDETFVKITNDAYFKVNLVMDDEYIVWRQYQALIPTRANSIYEQDVVFVSYEWIEDDDGAVPDTQEQQVYNYDVIYSVFVMASILGMLATLWIYEYGKDYDWWRSY